MKITSRSWMWRGWYVLSKVFQPMSYCQGRLSMRDLEIRITTSSLIQKVSRLWQSCSNTLSQTRYRVNRWSHREVEALLVTEILISNELLQTTPTKCKAKIECSDRRACITGKRSQDSDSRQTSNKEHPIDLTVHSRSRTNHQWIILSTLIRLVITTQILLLNNPSTNFCRSGAMSPMRELLSPIVGATHVTTRTMNLRANNPYSVHKMAPHHRTLSWTIRVVSEEK